MPARTDNKGPLENLRVVELGAIGPVPFCAMLLADMGADVLRIDAPGQAQRQPPHEQAMLRGRCRLTLDLKLGAHRDRLLSILGHADILIEGMRPGVLEHLGLSPEDCRQVNPRLVVGRMTGWGQAGPLADVPGHDPNFLALSGALHAMGYPDRPPLPPLNLVGDYGGGALYLAVGLLAALLHARQTGTGQVVDAAMLDGVASLLTPIYSMLNLGLWSTRRGSNIMDGSCPFGTTYETADGKYLVVAAIEPKFYRNLIQALGLDGEALPEQDDQSGWPVLRDRFAAVFKSRDRDEWTRLLADAECCVTPVLDLQEARQHPHNRARGLFTGPEQLPAAAPRFSETVTGQAPADSGPVNEQLRRWGVPGDVIESIHSRTEQ